MPVWQPTARSTQNLSQFCRYTAAWFLAAVLLQLCQISSAGAQFGPGIELSGTVSLDEADSAVRAHLERIKAYVADRQWDEAVETLRQVMDNHGGKMIPLTRSRYMNVTDFCHVQIACLPPEALALYRERVDPSAQILYDEGFAKRDAAHLCEVVDKMFCSSWGDDALWALGEIELERGHHGAARRYWEQLVEIPPARVSAARFEATRGQASLTPQDARLLDTWYKIDDSVPPQFYQLPSNEFLPDDVAMELVRLWKHERALATRLAYPGTSIGLADIRARLVLTSILEGSHKRARQELAAFAQRHPDAQGRLGGRSANYVETLTALAQAAEAWPEIKPSSDWPTFAGAATRTKVARDNLDLGARAWEPISLGEPLVADPSNSRAYSLRRIGEDSQRLLSFHPLVVGDLVLVNNQSQIFAFDLRTGAAAWPGDPKRPPGEIFVDEAALAATSRMNHGLGVPRFTMTAHRNKLYARMGSQVTSRPLESVDNGRSGYVVCLDLAAQGRAVWKPDGRIFPDDDKWTFEGSPLVEGANVYIAMRKSDVRPQAHVACFDAETGRRRWRTMICAAETPGGSQFEEITHNLLTLDQGTLYYNTNLGAVAALAARDGRLQWATLYPRAKKAGPDGQDKRTAHFYRDLNPCVYYRGILLVAPADCESVFAVDAASGELMWESHLPEDVVHLLGVGHDNLIAGGDSLWWIDVYSGKVVKHWPDTTPLGHGRGILMGDQVVWPTHDALYVFDQDPSASPAPPRDPILLSEERQAVGGNLVTAQGLFLIATPDKLFAFHQNGADFGKHPNVAARKNARAEPALAPDKPPSANMNKVVRSPSDP